MLFFALVRVNIRYELVQFRYKLVVQLQVYYSLREWSFPLAARTSTLDGFGGIHEYCCTWYCITSTKMAETVENLIVYVDN